MADIIRFMDLDIDTDKLPTQETVMSILHTYGETFGSLDLVNEEVYRQFGKDLIWRYPLCDGKNAGGIIIPVREGFLWLPYDEMDSVDYELLLTSEVRLLDADTCTFLIDALRSYVDGLCAALSDIRRLTIKEYDENADCDDQCVGCERACADRITDTCEQK